MASAMSDAEYWRQVSNDLRRAPASKMVSFPNPTEEGQTARPFSTLFEEKARPEAAEKKEDDAPRDLMRHWMPDRLCHTCYDCEAQFTMLRRRHHCRLCGQVFCNICSNYKVDGEVVGAPGVALRTCRLCFEQVKQWKQWKPPRRKLRKLGGRVGMQDVRAKLGQTYDVSTLRVVALAQTEEDNKPSKAADAEAASDLAVKAALEAQKEQYDRSGLHAGEEPPLPAVLDSDAEASPRYAGSPSRSPRQAKQGLTPTPSASTAASPAASTSTTFFEEEKDQPKAAASATGASSAPTRSLLGQILATRFTGESASAQDGNFVKEDILVTEEMLAGKRPFPQQPGLSATDPKPHEVLNRIASDHLTALVREMLQQTCPGISPEERTSWATTILRLSEACVASVETDVEAGDALDLRAYCKIKCIPGGTRKDSMLVEGPVFRKNVMTRGMPTSIDAPRILLLAGAIDYQRDASRLVSLDALVDQEQKYLEILVDKMMTLQPNVILVGQGVSREAQRIFQRKHPTVLVSQNVSRRVLDRVARSTGARIQRASDIVMTHPTPNIQQAGYLADLLLGADEDDHWDLAPDLTYPHKASPTPSEYGFGPAGVERKSSTEAETMSLASQTHNHDERATPPPTIGAAQEAPRGFSLAPGAASGDAILGTAESLTVELFDTGLSSKHWEEAGRPALHTAADGSPSKGYTDLETDTDTDGDVDLTDDDSGHDTAAKAERARRARGAKGTAYIFVRGCPIEYGCTMVLRGGDRFFLKQMKKILSFSLFAAYNLRLETSFYLDRGVVLVPPRKVEPDEEKRFLLSSSLLLDFGEPPSRTPMPWGTEKEGSSNESIKRQLGLGLAARPLIAADFSTLLVSSVWMAGKTQCCPADVKAIRFYSSQYDISVGQFLLESCFNLGLRCVNPECKAGTQKAVLRHKLSFSHGNRRLDIDVFKAGAHSSVNPSAGHSSSAAASSSFAAGESPVRKGMENPAEELDLAHHEEAEPAAGDPIYMWSYCKACHDIVTHKQELSPDTSKFSFGKMLEVLFYEKRVFGSLSTCSCSAGENHILYFGAGNLVARFERVRIAPMRISADQPAPFSRVRNWHEDFASKELGVVLGLALSYSRQLALKLKQPPDVEDGDNGAGGDLDAVERREAQRVCGTSFKVLRQALGQMSTRIVQLMKDVLEANTGSPPATEPVEPSAALSPSASDTSRPPRDPRSRSGAAVRSEPRVDAATLLYRRFPASLRIKLVGELTRVRYATRKYQELVIALERGEGPTRVKNPLATPDAAELPKAKAPSKPGEQRGEAGTAESEGTSQGGEGKRPRSESMGHSPARGAGAAGEDMPAFELDAALRPVPNRRSVSASDRIRSSPIAMLTKALEDVTLSFAVKADLRDMGTLAGMHLRRQSSEPTAVPERGTSGTDAASPGESASRAPSPNGRLADLLLSQFSLGSLQSQLQDLSVGSYLNLFLDEGTDTSQSLGNLSADETALKELGIGRPALGLGLGGRAVTVSEDRITSILAHTMLREEYAAQFQSIIGQTASVVHHTPDPESYGAPTGRDWEGGALKKDQESEALLAPGEAEPLGESDDARISLKELERRLLIPNKEHIKIKFQDGTASPEPCKFLCQVYYPVQFAALRALTLNEARGDGFVYPDTQIEGGGTPSSHSPPPPRRPSTAESARSADSKDGTHTPGSTCSTRDLDKHVTDILLDEDFIRSMACAEPWEAKGGKSGARFSRTMDGRFVIKHISKTELTMFLETAPSYFDYLSRVIFHKLPSVLCRILGVFQIGFHTKSHGKRQEHIVVMQDLFFGRKINLVYDLKGSTRNRYAQISREELEAEIHAQQVPEESLEAVSEANSYSADDHRAAGGDGSAAARVEGANLDASPGDSKIITNPYRVLRIKHKPRVLLDENLVQIFAGQPIPIYDQYKSFLSNAIMYDTWFLSLLNIVDYSIVVGVDRDSGTLVMGIIDYLRQYDLIKRMERVGKSVTMIAGQSAPTVIQPPQYRQRFRRQLERYFGSIPTKYTSEADLYLVPPLG